MKLVVEGPDPLITATTYCATRGNSLPFSAYWNRSARLGELGHVRAENWYEPPGEENFDDLVEVILCRSATARRVKAQLPA